MAFKPQSVGIQGVETNTCINANGARGKQEQVNENHETEFRSFLHDTTLHGARFLFVNNVFRREFWAVAVLSCLAYCSYQVYTSLTEFYRHPLHTKLTTIAMDGTEFSFPAVTLCNVNQLNTRRFRCHFEDVYKEEPTKERVERQLEDISLMIRRLKEVLTEEFRKRNPKLFHRAESVKEVIKHREYLSHQIEEMLLPSGPEFPSSSINGLPCTATNFIKKRSAAYGQRYTFNSAEGEGKGPLLNATMAGKNSGLKLRLNVERDSYIDDIRIPIVGLTVIIHDQTSYPFIEEFDVINQPGSSIECAIKRRKVINLPKPYETNCTNGAGSNLFSSSSIYAYTKEACLRKCRNDYTIRKCGCSPPELKVVEDTPICAVNDTFLCVYQSHEDFGISKEKRACEKNCPEPCQHVEYKTSFSYGGLQRGAVIGHLMSFLQFSNASSVGRTIYEPLLNMTKLQREKYIEDNIISLDIYFEDLAQEVITQRPLYGNWSLIGNLGGTFGLVLGMSILTVLEFLDFAFMRMCHLFKKEGDRKQNARTTNVE